MKKILLFITMTCMFAGLNAGTNDFVNDAKQGPLWVAFNSHKSPYLIEEGKKYTIPAGTKTMSISNADTSSLFPHDIIVRDQKIDSNYSARMVKGIDNKFKIVSIH